GADVGTQYRSAIFYHSEEQRETAEQKIEQIDASGRWQGSIVTEVTALETFYPAEDYHQEYYRQHQRQPYCQMVITPKVKKLHQHYESKLKTKAVGR
ncbi:MAG: peptide-methionine (S)-S-oxide reductase, partial [Chloroflexi bacterium]|nr:peptide-methionine (S)-S-oxide reductase [Chloroflexota bacterium]